MGITTGLHGHDKLAILRMHRIIAFQETWDKYLKGEINAMVVKYRAKKMLEIGLPFKLK